MNANYKLIIIALLLGATLFVTSFFVYWEFYEYKSGYKLDGPMSFDGKILKGFLSYKGWARVYRRKSSPIYANISFSANFEADNELTIIITDSENTRFTLPNKAPFPFTKNHGDLQNPMYDIEYEENQFSFKVIRKSTQEIIFNTKDHPLMFSDKYIEFGTDLPTPYIYGLGERRRNFLYNPGTYTIWPKDQVALNYDGKPGNQVYGQHPVYLAKEKSGNYHCVFLKSTNPMDVLFDGSGLTYKIVGGRIELKFFLGDNRPDTSIKLYHHYINGYTLMPFWAFGYHQCKWGYKSTEEILQVVRNFTELKLPIDTIWSDIDYMYHYEDFTVNTENFTLKDFQTIKSYDLKLVPILDIGVAYGNNTAYQDGLKKNVFIKSQFTGEPLINWVWPGQVSYPDFNHPNVTEYWGNLMKSLHGLINYDGLWLDMNEPSAFVNGEIINSSKAFFEGDYTAISRNFSILTEFLEITQEPAPVLSKDYPYLPGAHFLNEKTISENALHTNKGIFIEQEAPLVELDYHSLDGFSEAKVTYEVLKKEIGHLQPFIIARSTGFGGGNFTSHWTGDNQATWLDLQESISNIFNQQIYGIPFVGADICGFQHNTTEELCARWMQVGCFYPFSRNHNEIGALPQEPFAWGNDSIVFKASMASLKLRYSLLKFYYSLFVRAKGSGSIFRPLFFEFTEDETIQDLDSQFLLGSELMVAPVLESNVSQVKVYFPKGATFYCYNKGFKFGPESFHELQAPITGAAPLFIRESAIVFTNDVEEVVRTSNLTNHFTLKVAFKLTETTPLSVYEAEGSILGISNLESESVLNNCVSKNCIVNIKAKGIRKDPTVDEDFLHVVLDLVSNENVVLEEIYVDALEVYGVKTDSGYRVIRHELKTPIQLSFSVINGISINMRDGV